MCSHGWIGVALLLLGAGWGAVTAWAGSKYKREARAERERARRYVAATEAAYHLAQARSDYAASIVGGAERVVRSTVQAALPARKKPG